MAGFELFISQARRHCFTKSSYQLSLLLRSAPSLSHSTAASPFLGLHRSLCSSSSPESTPATEDRSNEPPTRPQPPPIQAVSYAVKPKDSPPSPPQEDPRPSIPIPRQPREPAVELENPITSEARAWTREDFRYVKHVPNISPVSYRSRVAPLPEDRVAVSDEGEVKADENARREEKKEGDEQLATETRRIQADNRRIRWGLRTEEERLPFPTLIKEEKKKEKAVYDLQEAIRLVKVNAKANFNETVEVHVNLAPELRRTDLKLDGIASLPHGTGKASKIAVFADGYAADEARAAGADIVGGVELVESIKKGNVKADFDICVTTHQFVKQLQPLAKILKRQMPSTKAGTVTDDVAKVVKESKRIVKFNKKDKAAVVHVGIGKVSFSEEALRENIGAFVNGLLLAKPAGLKKSSKYAGYVNSVHICSTMGPGFHVSVQSLSIAADRYNKLHQT